MAGRRGYESTDGSRYRLRKHHVYYSDSKAKVTLISRLARVVVRHGIHQKIGCRIAIRDHQIQATIVVHITDGKSSTCVDKLERSAAWLYFFGR